jgi:hypothetical protein
MFTRIWTESFFRDTILPMDAWVFISTSRKVTGNEIGYGL